jgi:hypothetical protein
MMRSPTWPKAFAYLGITVMGLVLAFYSTSIASAGVAGMILRTDRPGDTLSLGSAFVIVGIALAAAFGYLALRQVRALTRKT